MGRKKEEIFCDSVRRCAGVIQPIAALVLNTISKEGIPTKSTRVLMIDPRVVCLVVLITRKGIQANVARCSSQKRKDATNTTS